MQNRSSQVILATGKLYPQSGLQPGMELLDEHSNPQTIRHIERRRVPAFEVRPFKGEPFYLGFDQKILAPSEQNRLLCEAAEYAQQASSRNEPFELIRPQLSFPAQALPLEPYFLGLLLGRGCFRGLQPCLTTADPEVAEAVYDVADQRQWPLRVAQGGPSNAYFFKKARRSLKEDLQALGLWERTSSEKFIPEGYLRSSREDRLALLAGLIDSEGCCVSRFYEITTASFRLAEDVAFLARGLGLTVAEKERKLQGRRYARVFLYGGLEEIPLRVHRKRLQHCYQKSPSAQARFTVYPAGLQDVFYIDVESYLTGDLTLRKGDAL